MGESARDMPDQRHLEQSVRTYFAAKGEWARLAAVAAAEQLVDTSWMSELIARRRAADDALAAARASLHTTITASASGLMTAIAEVRWHAAADKRHETQANVSAELNRLHRARRERLTQLTRQLRHVSEAKEALLSRTRQANDPRALRLQEIARRAIVARHYPRGPADGHVVDEPVVAVAVANNGDLLVYVDGDENATIAEHALGSAGVRVRRELRHDGSGSNGVRLVVPAR